MDSGVELFRECVSDLSRFRPFAYARFRGRIRQADLFAAGWLLMDFISEDLRDRGRQPASGVDQHSLGQRAGAAEENAPDNPLPDGNVETSGWN